MSVYHALVEHILLPLADKAAGSKVMGALRKVRSYDTCTTSELETLQADKLSELLEHAVSRTEYYRDLNVPRHEDPYQWLKAFPILEKQDIRHHEKAMCDSGSTRKLYTQKSSGSSGYQTTVYMDQDDIDRYRAQQIHWWEWAGYRLGTPVLQTGITPKRGMVKRIKDVLLRTTYVPAFSHDEHSVVAALNTFSRRQDGILAGYASSLYVMAQIAQKRALDVHFESAISWGDKLFPHYKELIEKVFGCKVYETYGSSEGLLIASKHDTEFMYINTPHIVLEIVDDLGNEVRDGEMGHVVVTGLSTKAMPLIRYRLGDLAIKLPREKYPKSSRFAYPLLQRVIGRDTDIVKTRTGKSMVVHSFTGIFEHFQLIRQYQIRQVNLDGIEILYIPETKCDTSVLAQIRSMILDEIQEPFVIDFIKVDRISASPSGKPQIITSKLKKS